MHKLFNIGCGVVFGLGAMAAIGLIAAVILSDFTGALSYVVATLIGLIAFYIGFSIFRLTPYIGP